MHAGPLHAAMVAGAVDDLSLLFHSRCCPPELVQRCACVMYTPVSAMQAMADNLEHDIREAKAEVEVAKAGRPASE
jgi:hypothetical protein